MKYVGIRFDKVNVVYHKYNKHIEQTRNLKIIYLQLNIGNIDQIGHWFRLFSKLCTYHIFE